MAYSLGIEKRFGFLAHVLPLFSSQLVASLFNQNPSIDMAPLQQELFGQGAVPVWFVSMEDLQAAIENDNRLTIGELADMPSLKIGNASFYHETLHPWGGSVRNHLVFDAHGLLADETAPLMFTRSIPKRISM